MYIQCIFYIFHYKWLIWNEPTQKTHRHPRLHLLTFICSQTLRQHFLSVCVSFAVQSTHSLWDFFLAERNFRRRRSSLGYPNIDGRVRLCAAAAVQCTLGHSQLLERDCSSKVCVCQQKRLLWKPTIALRCVTLSIEQRLFSVQREQFTFLFLYSLTYSLTRLPMYFAQTNGRSVNGAHTSAAHRWTTADRPDTVSHTQADATCCLANRLIETYRIRCKQLTPVFSGARSQGCCESHCIASLSIVQIVVQHCSVRSSHTRLPFVY